MLYSYVIIKTEIKTIFYYSINMDIIQQLPFPDEICHKIVLYAFKSPHTHLQEEIFKRVVPTHIYQKLVEKGGIEKVNGYITKVCVWDYGDEQLLDDDDLKSLQFDIKVLQGLQNLTEFHLMYTGVTWDIQVLQGLPHLTKFDLSETGVTGDIQFLQGLPNLTEFNLNYTRVFGDIKVLQGLQHLTVFHLDMTGVTGDIQVLQGFHNLTEFHLDGTGVTGYIKVLQGFRNLTEFSLGGTGVTGDIKFLQGLQHLTTFYLYSTDVFGDEEAFHEYRKSRGLEECVVMR